MTQHKIDPKSIAITVITSYPKWYQGSLRSIRHTDKVRGDLALELIKKAINRGFIVVCADEKSSKTFKKELTNINDLILIQRRSGGSGVSKRQAIKKAIKIEGVKVIVLTEPEKISLATDCINGIVDPILSGRADIVVPKRQDSLFKSTYPEYMFLSESEGNNIYNEALRTNGILKPNMKDLDMFFGPRAFINDKKVVALFMRRYSFAGESMLGDLYDPDTYSNTLFFPIINALKQKMQVESVEVPFSYPKIQKENEEVEARDIFVMKRNLQRTNLLIDLMHFLSFLERKKSSKIRSPKR